MGRLRENGMVKIAVKWVEMIRFTRPVTWSDLTGVVRGYGEIPS
jgi:hypothetical protein